MLVHLANVHILPDRVYHGCNSVASRDNLLCQRGLYLFSYHLLYLPSTDKTKSIGNQYLICVLGYTNSPRTLKLA